jgi:hypothetical protein
MAKATNNILLAQLSGTIGKQLTVMQRGGQTIVSKAKKKIKRRPSDKQMDARFKFMTAASYGKWVMENPDLKEVYQAAVKPGQNAYNLAVSDAYNPPEVQDVRTDGYHGHAGDTIIVRAIDDFRVFQVIVSIYTAAGQLLEEGNALQCRNVKDWTYTAKQENPDFKGGWIVAMAEDLAGNCTESKVSI